MVFDPSIIDDANKRTLTIAAADIDSDLSNYPLTVYLGSAVGQGDFDATPVFDELGSSSKKLAIEAGGVQCPVEIEYWDDTAETAVLHTCVPTVSSSTDTELVLSFDSTQDDNDGGGDDRFAVLLIHSDTTDGSTTFTDSSGSAHTITANGSVEHSDAYAKFGATSMAMGTSNYLTLADSADWAPTTDWTVDLWTYLNSVSTWQGFIAQWPGSSDRAWALCTEGTPKLQFSYTTDGSTHLTNLTAASYVPPTGQWVHLAVVKRGTTVKVYADGVEVISGTLSGTIYNSSASLEIGAFATGAAATDGYIDEVRVSQIARWTTAFTPPAMAYHKGGVFETGEIGAQAVWDSDFAAVYHLAQDPSGTAPQILDSTSNGNDGTSAGSMTSGDLVTSGSHLGLALDGSDDCIGCGNEATVNPNYITIESLVATNPATNQAIVGKDYISGSTYDRCFQFRFYGGVLQFIVFTDDSTYAAASGSSTPGSGDVALLTCSFDGTTVKTYLHGSQNGSASLSGVIQQSQNNDLYLGKVESDPVFYGAGSHFEHRLSSVARSAAWIDATNGSLSDGLITWSDYGTPALALRRLLEQDFSLCAPLRGALEQTLSLPERLVLEQTLVIFELVRQAIFQDLSLPQRAIFNQVFRDAPVLRQVIGHVFADTVLQRQCWQQGIGDAILLRRALEQVFSASDTLRQVLAHDFALAGQALRQITGQVFALEDIERIRRGLYQVYGLLGADGEQMEYTLAASIAGEAATAGPVTINIERDIDLYYITCELVLADQAAWAQYRRLSPVVLDVNGHSYTFIVTERSRDRSHGAREYRVLCMSPSVQLGHGYAETVSGELTGFASQIAANLAPGFTIDWQIHDEYYGAGQLIAAGEYPIEIIANLAAAMKGVVQSQADGTTISIIYPEPVAVPERHLASADYTLSDAEDFFTSGESPDKREGYNCYLVSDQATAADTLRQEEEAVSDYLKEIRVYQTPWDGSATLGHTGGDWVEIEPMGDEEREIVEEMVAFEDGAGRTAYPLYTERLDGTAATPVLTWREANLGTVTFSEDGSLESAVTGDSLLALTYWTRCRLWRVRDPRSEQVQLVAEDIL